MIRHLAELGALLLCFAVGVGLVAAFFVGLAWIWRSPDSAIEDEYRRVESKGTMPIMEDRAWLEDWELEETLLLAEELGFPYSSYVPSALRPYNWATREPMVWTEPHV
jgi:hypothetical protein